MTKATQAKTAANATIGHNSGAITLKDIDKAILSVKSRGKKLKNYTFSNALIPLVDHYTAHGDLSRLNGNDGKNLESAVREAFGSSAVKAMNTWLVNAVPALTWDEDENKIVSTKGESKAIVEAFGVGVFNTKKESLEGENPRDVTFFDLQRPTSEKPLDVQQSVISLIKRAKKAVEDGKPVENADMIDQLDAIIKNIEPAH